MVNQNSTLKFFLVIIFVFLTNIGMAQNVDSTKISLKPLKKHSPTKATLYSTFLPGLGQIYNKQAWKVPIVYAGLGTVAYFAITNYNGATKFHKEYNLRANGITIGRNPQYVNYPDQSIYNLYYAYEKNFELSLFAGAAVYIFNILDAMVYAHLFDYDISPNLALNIKPFYIPSYSYNGLYPTMGFSMKLSFK